MGQPDELGGAGDLDGDLQAGLAPVVVVMPTYNEAANLVAVHRRLRAADRSLGLLVVDDASPDGTGQVADAIAREDPLMWVLHRRRKEGLGSAYLAGMEVALASGAEIVVEMDADGSHQPEQLVEVVAAVRKGADVAIGSRYVGGGAWSGWPWYRVWLSRAGNAYAKAALGLGISDSTSGFRAYSRRALAAIDLGAVRSRGYCFQVEMVYRAVVAGLVVTEVPITFVDRQEGRSKMTLRVVWEMSRLVAVWGGRRILGGRRGGASAGSTCWVARSPEVLSPVADPGL